MRKGHIQRYEDILKESRWYFGRRSMFIRLITDLRAVVKDCVKYRNILSVGAITLCTSMILTASHLRLRLNSWAKPSSTTSNVK